MQLVDLLYYRIDETRYRFKYLRGCCKMQASATSFAVKNDFVTIYLNVKGFGCEFGGDVHRDEAEATHASA